MGSLSSLISRQANLQEGRCSSTLGVGGTSHQEVHTAAVVFRGDACRALLRRVSPAEGHADICAGQSAAATSRCSSRWSVGPQKHVLGLFSVDCVHFSFLEDFKIKFWYKSEEITSLKITSVMTLAKQKLLTGAALQVDGLFRERGYHSKNALELRKAKTFSKNLDFSTYRNTLFTTVQRKTRILSPVCLQTGFETQKGKFVVILGTPFI